MSADPLLRQPYTFCITTSGLHRISVDHFISSVSLMHAIAGPPHLNHAVGHPPMQSGFHIQSAQLTIMWPSYTRSGVTRSLLLFTCDCCTSPSSYCTCTVRHHEQFPYTNHAPNAIQGSRINLQCTWDTHQCHTSVRASVCST